MKGSVVSFCDHTGNMVRPWAETGYQCWCYDLQHNPGIHQNAEDNGIFWVGCDLLKGFVPLPSDVVMAFAFPACTDLSASGARWWKGKGLKALSRAIELVGRCADLCDESGAPWCLENPIGSLSTYWRKPDAQFDPCDYGGYLDPIGDQYTKKTCLWTGNGFVVPVPKPVFPVEGSRMHLLPPSENRANIRSETPMGFAKAVFEANEPVVSKRVKQERERRKP